MNNSGMAATYEGNVGKYGMVIASHKYLPSNDAETKGSFTGSVQAINDAGKICYGWDLESYRYEDAHLRLRR